jgi:hypothetical protein
MGSVNKIMVQACLDKKCDTLSEKYSKQKAWERGTSGRAPAEPGQGPELHCPHRHVQKQST